ncbi:hypothetical protein GGF32_000723 [Allomyces javanicus]|nr:hypothetical protein GGF32_000723 [Allomyces javanicus]
MFSVAGARRDHDDRPLGPIPYRELRSLFIGRNATPSFVLATLPYVRRIAWSMRNMDMTECRALVAVIAGAGGVPDAVTDVDLRLPTGTTSWGIVMSSVVGRLADLLGASRIRNLALRQVCAAPASRATTAFEWFLPGAAVANNLVAPINASMMAACFCTLIDGFAAKCPNFKRLKLFSPSRAVPAVDWTAYEIVFSALTSAVSNFQRLILSNNCWINNTAIPLLLRLIEYVNVVNIDLNGTLVDHCGREQVAAAIKTARQKRFDGDATAFYWTYGPPAGLMRGIFLIPAALDWKRRDDCAYVAEMNQQPANRPLGPIPFHQLRLSTLGMYFTDEMIVETGADVAIRRLARVLAKSSVRELCVSFDISLRSREWNKPAVLRASQWLMNHGLPRGLMTLRLDGLWGPYIGGGEEIPPYTVAWPVSLRHLYLNLGHAYGNESVVVAQLLTSLATAKVPNLVTLDVTGANFDQSIVAHAIVAALPATLTTLRLAQYYPRHPKPEDTEHLCPVFHAIADKCPRLQSLHVEPKILFERNELAVLARDTIPLLRAMTNLTTLALVAWDLTAADRSFWVALADAVPHLLVLDLSQNQNLDDGVVNQLEPLIQHGHLRRLVMMGTTLSRKGRMQLSAMIQQAQWIPVASVFLEEGLPQTTLTTLRIQLAKGWARGSRDAVQWPPSLRCIDLDLQTRFGDVHVVNLLVSLSRANLPRLDALVLNNVAESVSVVDAIIAVLQPSLTVLCVGAVFPAIPIAINDSVMAARFRALIDGAAAKCPNLKRLHLFPASCIVSDIDRTAVVADVIPRLRNLANLTDISLCEWGMMATDEAVFPALATAVPNLQHLDLSNNRWITGQVVPLLLPLIERGNVVGIDLTGTLVDRSGRDQVAAAIKRARQKRCAAAAAVDAA